MENFNTDAPKSLDMIEQETLFTNLIEGKDKIHEVKLSNGLIVKINTPTSLQVAAYRLQALSRMKEENPKMYAALQKSQEEAAIAMNDPTFKFEPFNDPMLQFYLELGYMLALWQLITPTFEDFETEVDDDDIWNFLNALNDIDRSVLFMKYLEISGANIQAAEEKMNSFRKESKRKRAPASDKS